MTKSPHSENARLFFAHAVERMAKRNEADPIFYSRLGFRYHMIVRLFEELYGEAKDFPRLLERLEDRLFDAYRDRPLGLKKLDLERERKKAWYLEPGLAAYMLYLDRFSGDLGAFQKRIPYLEELGVRLVHFMPFFKSPPGNSDGGYAVSDYLGLDPRFGGVADLVETAEALHERGIYLAADLVLNHSADDHPWALAARGGDQHYKDYYYVFPDRGLPDRFEAAMPEVFPETAPGNFTWVPEIRSWVMTVFHNFQWDLNWSNPELFLEMLTVLLGMANMGIDLLRLDAVPYLWKIPGTSCQNLPQAHQIVRLLKACADVAAPGIAFLAEAIVQPSEIVRYLDSGGIEECQLAYHASLMVLLWDAIATRKTRLLADSLDTEARLPRSTAWLSYVRCHDDIGLGYDEEAVRRAGFDPLRHKGFMLAFYSGVFQGSFARGRLFMENPETGDARLSGTCASLCGLESALEARDESGIELALRRIELLYGLVSSLVGIPMIFSGDELGLINDYSWESKPELAEDNRWMHRPSLDWIRAEARKSSGSIEARIFGSLRNYLSLRRDIPALAQDSPFEILPLASENILACLRGEKTAKDRLLVLANFAPEERSIGLASLGAKLSPASRDRLSGGQIRTRGGDLFLEAYELLWIEA